MARNKISLSFRAFEEMAEKLDELQGDLKKITQEALVESKKIVTKNLQQATNKANYPAQGKYSTGETRESIDTTTNVTWESTTGSIKVGFDFNKSGLVSIFLMYGTPRMPKVQAIYDAVYGKRTKSQIAKIQKQIFAEAIREKMEG